MIALQYLADTSVHPPSFTISNAVLFVVAFVLGVIVRGKF